MTSRTRLQIALWCLKSPFGHSLNTASKAYWDHVTRSHGMRLVKVRGNRFKVV